MRIGLVLGGGGTFGLGYHAGALAALANDCRWDPRDADVIVGTSAGAIVATLLRTGVPAHDLAASMVGVDLHETPLALARSLADRPPAPALGFRQLARVPRVPAAAVLARAAARPWTISPSAALVSVVPDGRADLAQHVPLLKAWDASPWPERPLWLAATRRRDLTRVVLGRDGAVPARLAHAVAASCAVPGYFAPVPIDGDAYVDGGVRSSTNADVLAGRALDLVVVVAPLASSGGAAPLGQRAWRRYVTAQVEREQRRLARGVPTVVVAPGPSVSGPFGSALMATDRLAELTSAAFLDAGDQLQRAGLPELLAGVPSLRH